MRSDRTLKPVMMIEEGGRGGVTDYTVALVAALVARGQPVELVTASDHLLPELEGVTVLGWFHYLRPTSTIARGLRALRLGPVINGLSFLVAYFRCIPRARRCRLVHIQGGTWRPLTLPLVLVLRCTGVGVVHTPHNTFAREGERGWEGHSLEWAASKTIVHAEADLKNLAYPDGAVIIPHGEYATLADGGQDISRDQARSNLGIGPDAPVTLVFGQLREDKGIIDVLTAAAEVPDLVVLIAGEDVGGLAAASPLIRSEALRGRVVIRQGFLSMDEAAEAFAATDTVTLAYRQASQSGVLMLAYGFGRPVVIYPTGGLPEAVVDGETGWICERSDPGSLADSLRAAATAGPLECRRRGDAAARLARSDFSWDEIARRTLLVYDEVSPAGSSVMAERATTASGSLAERSAARNRMLLLGAAAGANSSASRPALASRRIKGPISRLLAKQFGPDGHEWNLNWFESVAAGTTVTEPRVLVRVDEFPNYSAFDHPHLYGVERATAFHEVMAEAGVQYLMAIVPQLTRAPLDPGASGGRSLGAPELALIETMRQDGVVFAQHGTTHRTRHRSPRRRSEFTGMSDRDLRALLDRGAARLAEAGIESRILVPPFNRFSARQLSVFAERFDVVTGGPESVRLMGSHYGPSWQGDIVYMPCMPPLYGTARQVLPALRRLESATGVWIPVTLHVTWELDDDLVGLRELAEYLGEVAAPWQEFLDAVDLSRSAA